MNQLNKKLVTPLDVHVEFECYLSSACCCVLASEIIRYVLYQRHQIPLQVQVLQREVEKHANVQEKRQLASSAPVGHTGPAPPPPDSSNCQHQLYQEHSTNEENEEQLITETMESTSASLRMKHSIQQSRMKQAVLRQEHIWRRYFTKVEKFVKHFQMITQALQDEVTRPGSEVRAVRLAMGTAYATSREVYTLHLPRMAPSTRAVPKSHSDAAIVRTLFRSFVTNEELTKLVNTSSGIKRIWIMVLKPRRPATRVTDAMIVPEAQQQQAQVARAGGGASVQPLTWLARLKYKPLQQARLVNINIVAPDWLPPPSCPLESTSAPSIPPLAKITRGRRLLPSLVRGAGDRRFVGFGCKRSRESEEELAMEDESLLKELELFELTPLNSPTHACTPATKKEFAKPLAPPPSRARKGQRKSKLYFASPLCAYNRRVGDTFHTPSSDADHTYLDMVETPVATSHGTLPSCFATPTAGQQNHKTEHSFKTPRSQCCSFSTSGLDRTQTTPSYPGETAFVSTICKNGPSSSEKPIPLPMVETPIVRSDQANWYPNADSSQHPNRLKALAANSSVLTMTTPIYNRNGSSTSKKYDPALMVETPVVSSYQRQESKTPCTSRLHARDEFSTCEKLTPVPMVETPFVSTYGRHDLKTPSSSSLFRRDESSTCKKCVSVPMVETPVVSTYGRHDFKTPSTSSMFRRDESSTCKKCVSVPMVETPVVSTYGRHDFKTPSTSSLFRRDESSTCKKLVPVPMVETPVVSWCVAHEQRGLQNEMPGPSTLPVFSKAISMSKCKSQSLENEFYGHTEIPCVSIVENEVCRQTSTRAENCDTVESHNTILDDKFVHDPVIKCLASFTSPYTTDNENTRSMHTYPSTSLAYTDSSCDPSSEDLAGIAPDTSFNVSNHNVVDMIQTPVATMTGTHKTNAVNLETKTVVCGEKSVTVDDQRPTAIEVKGHPEITRWQTNMTDDTVHDCRRSVFAAQERGSEGRCNDVTTPTDRCVQKTNQWPPSAPAKTALQGPEIDNQEKEAEELVWYQLSLPLVGFKEKPVSRCIPNNNDDEDSWPF